MAGHIRPFEQPIHVTRPLLPDLELVTAKLQEVWSAQWLTNNGPQHCQFEQRLLEVLKAPHLSLFNNGTIALIVACQSLRLSGEVITTPFTFAATPHVLTWNGIRPVFCDIDPATMNIDPARIESLITPQTTAILGVHVFGTPCEVTTIQEIADRYGLRVVYDAAHAFGVEIDGRGIGTFGDITMFSFHATKLFHSAEGGALTFSDPNLKARIDLLKNFGIKNEDVVMMPGINGKMNEIQAALGLVLLDCVEAERARRHVVETTYRALLEGVEGLTFSPVAPEGLRKSYQYLVVRINEEIFGVSRDAVYQQLRHYNVLARKYFYPLCSDYACYRQLPSATPASLPVANRIASEVLALPFYGALQLEEVEQICAIILSCRKRAGQ